METLLFEYQSRCRGEFVPPYEMVLSLYPHLPKLREYARKVESVTDLGCYFALNCAFAFVLGLAEEGGGVYHGVDVAPVLPNVLSTLKAAGAECDVEVRFTQANDQTLGNLWQSDLLFIDTLHTYGHLSFELTRFSPLIRKFIILNNTSGPWETADDVAYRGDRTEYPPDIDREKRGTWSAVQDFLSLSGREWVLKERYTHANGLTVLERRRKA